MSPATEKYEQDRVATVGVLVALIEGKIGTILASRKLAFLRHTLVGDQLDDDWRTFIGIDSETDDLPAGDERRHWAPDALAAKDIEILRAEDMYRAPGLIAARNLLQRYKGPIPPRQTTTGSSAPDHV
jgi:hypothetical protein